MDVIGIEAQTTRLLRLLGRSGRRVLPVLWLLYLPVAAAAQNAPAPGPASRATAFSTLLPQDLSAWGMIQHADWLMKLVMADFAVKSLALYGLMSLGQIFNHGGN